MGADEANFDSKWPFFKLLCFLKDIVAPRASTGNLSGAQGITNSTCPTNGDGYSSTQLQGDENAIQPQNAENETESPVSARHESVDFVEGQEVVGSQERVDNGSIYTPKSTKQTKKRARNEEFNSSILSIEQKKLEYLMQKRDRRQSLEEDADLYFFKSLLPHVRRIPEERKMCFRSRIQSLVDEFAYPSSRDQHQMMAHSASTSSSSANADISADVMVDPFAAAFFKEF